MSTVTKRDLIEKIAERTNQKRTAVKDTVQTFLDLIVDELEAGNRLEFRDFGVFETKARAARMAQNPKTLERVPVPAKTTVKFKVGRLMRERVENGGEAGDSHNGSQRTGGSDANEANPAIQLPTSSRGKASASA